MSDSQEQPWSDDPDAPNISHRLYFDEKAYSAGLLISSILYGMPCNAPRILTCLSVFALFARVALGIIIMLFFQCMAGLFSPVHCKGDRGHFFGCDCGNRNELWILVRFLRANREFPGVEGVSPGALTYQISTTSSVLAIISSVSFPLNNWLVDGLLVSPLPDVAFTHPRV